MAENQQQNFMIVDGLLGDYVQEVSAYLDQLNGLQPAQEGGLEDTTSKLMEDENSENQEETFKAIAEKSHIVSKAPEKDFESAYNLILHILTFSSKLTEILPILLKNLLEHTPEYPNGSLMVLSVLTNLFNILPVQSPLRYQVFISILDFAKSTSNAHLLVNQLKQLPQWIFEWGIEESKKQQVYVKVSEVLSTLDPESSYKYLFDAVSCITVETADGSNDSLTSQLVKTALASDEIYDFDDILALPAVQKLKDNAPDLYKLLGIVSSGDSNAFASFNGKVTDVDMEAVESKVKVLALAALAFQCSADESVSYESISKAINVPEDEVELWVIDAIRAKLVEGQLCQIEKKFAIHRATPIGKFGQEEWKEVAVRLDKWKTSLRDVYDVIRNARENAQKERANKIKQATAAQAQQQAA